MLILVYTVYSKQFPDRNFDKEFVELNIKYKICYECKHHVIVLGNILHCTNVHVVYKLTYYNEHWTDEFPTHSPI